MILWILSVQDDSTIREPKTKTKRTKTQKPQKKYSKEIGSTEEEEEEDIYLSYFYITMLLQL